MLKLHAFEKEFGVDPMSFSSMTEMDAFVEKKIGRKLRAVPYGIELTGQHGNVFPVTDAGDIDEKLDEVLGLK